jgi:hypothetical protein
MRMVLSALWIAFFALLGSARAASADSALSAAIDGAWREPQSRARDAYRHPYESLAFWGLKPGMTVVEVDPGAREWWTEILAPYARATGGAYIAALPDRAQSGAAAESPDAAHAAFWRGVADKSVFGEVKAYDFGPQHPDSIPAGSVDLVLVARAFHNWARPRRRNPNLSARLFHDVEAGRHSRQSNSTVRLTVRTRAPKPVMSRNPMSSRRRARWGSSSRQSPRSTPTQKTPKTILSAFGRCPDASQRAGWAAR